MAKNGEPKTLHPRPKLAAKLDALGLPSFEKKARWLSAQGIEISGSFLSMLVSGKRDMSANMSRALSEALGMPIEDVIGS